MTLEVEDYRNMALYLIDHTGKTGTCRLLRISLGRLNSFILGDIVLTDQLNTRLYNTFKTWTARAMLKEMSGSSTIR